MAGAGGRYGRRVWGKELATSGAGRIAYLDGIRALAISTVVLVHWVASQLPFALGGYIGVDIFFVLSGYIITTMLWRSKSTGRTRQLYGRFMRRRFVRLYPALVGAIFGTAILYALFPGAPLKPSDLIPSGAIALLQGSSFYAASGAAHGSPYAATWSLSIEWLFYLLWPLAVYRAKGAGITPRRLSRWTLYVAGAIYALSLFQEAHWFYYGPVARVSEILVGSALALFMVGSPGVDRSVPSRKAAEWLGIAFIAALITYSLFGPVQWDTTFRLVGLPLAVSSTVYLIWLGAQSPTGMVARVLSFGPLTLIGRVSYSLYLWHAIGVLLFTRENTGGLNVILVAFLGVMLAVVTTALSYRYLELPFLRSRTNALSPKSSGVAESAKEKTR